MSKLSPPSDRPVDPPALKLSKEPIHSHALKFMANVPFRGLDFQLTRHCMYVYNTAHPSQAVL